MSEGKIVNFEIDGIPIAAPDSFTIYDAARMAHEYAVNPEDRASRSCRVRLLLNPSRGTSPSSGSPRVTRRCSSSWHPRRSSASGYCAGTSSRRPTILKPDGNPPRRRIGPSLVWCVVDGSGSS